MKLKDVGERTIIEFARKVCKTRTPVKVGVGDDAAVLRLGNVKVVVTTDMLVAETHFPKNVSPEAIGEKAVAVNLSDLAAMGARPLAVLFSVGFPTDTNVKFVKQLIRSMYRTAKRYGCQVVGGDVCESPVLTVGGIALGICEGNVLKRSGARPRDLIGITGKTGAAAAGLDLMKNKRLARKFPSLVGAQLKPRARVAEGLALAKTPGVTSAIDISDGLARNLWQLAKESGVKMVLERIPVDPRVEKASKHARKSAAEYALYGGEDYELLFTFRPGAITALKQAFAKIRSRFLVIGRVEKGRGVYLRIDKKLEQVPDRGFEHFTIKT